MGGNGIMLENDVVRYFADAEALYSYEGTREMNTLIVGPGDHRPQRVRPLTCACVSVSQHGNARTRRQPNGRAATRTSTAAGPVSGRPRGHTAASLRSRSTPTMPTAASVPAASSPATANELSTAGPTPAATAPLIAVVEASCSAGSASAPPTARSEERPGAGPVLAGDERRRGQPCDVHAPPARRPRMVGGDDEGEPVAGDDLGVEVVGHRRALDEAEVGVPGAHVRGDVGGVVRGERDGGLRELRAQGDQPARQQVLGHRQARRDPQPRGLLDAQRRHPGVEGVGRVDGDPGPVGDERAGRGETGAARGALQQRHAERALERADARTDGGLRDAVSCGGTAHAAERGDREQHVERTEVDHAGTQGHKRSL